VKHIKTFESFLNESNLPFSLEKELQSNKAKFVFDEDLTEEDDDRSLDNVEIYVWDDRKSGIQWLGKVGKGPGFYYLEIQKDETIVYSHKYPKSQKQSFEQDCENSLGFSPDF
jgi:hypothetical protein